MNNDFSNNCFHTSKKYKCWHSQNITVSQTDSNSSKYHRQSVFVDLKTAQNTFLIFTAFIIGFTAFFCSAFHSLFFVCFTHACREQQHHNKFMASKNDLLRWLLCWSSFFTSLNVPLEALDSLLILQQSTAVAPIGNFLQLFWTLADYITSTLVLWKRKLPPWILIKLVTFVFVWLLQLMSWFLVKWIQFRIVISIERVHTVTNMEQTFNQMCTCGMWFESQMKR